jgi:hypothetical protein
MFLNKKIFEGWGAALLLLTLAALSKSNRVSLA